MNLEIFHSTCTFDEFTLVKKIKYPLLSFCHLYDSENITSKLCVRLRCDFDTTVRKNACNMNQTKYIWTMYTFEWRKQMLNQLIFQISLYC